MKNINIRISLFVLLALGIVHVSFAGRPAGVKSSTPLAKTATNGTYVPMDINNIFNYYANNGDGSFNPYSVTNEGFEFPIGSTAGTCVFEDGLVWTAFKQDTLYCGGSTYNHGLQAGRILTAGTSSSQPVPDDPSNSANRIYRVCPDVRPTNNADTIAVETSLLQNRELAYINRFQSTTASALLQQYWNDWDNWPAAQGAPYTDVNNDGVYEPTIDIPGVPGADQTQWMVMNDMNPTLTIGLYGSNPIGLEVQRTIWAYHQPGALENTIFLSYNIINKSGVELDTMYVSQWADPDLGYAGDDAIGCDTAASLGYAYNGVPKDSNFTKLGLAPPSVGFALVQGPIVAGRQSDTALVDGRYVPGRKALPMTAFTFYLNGYSPVGYFDFGDAAQEMYNTMRGLVSTTGQPFPAAVTGGGKFCYPGDPITSTGPTFTGPARVAPPGDVRMTLSSGPFRMNPGDTQQVVVAALAAQGSDYMSSVSLLKFNTLLARSAYIFLSEPDQITSVRTSGSQAPNSFALLQNYPNPFNPSTTIRYELPALSRVSISIYDILGQKVRVLVDEVESAGPQFQVWNSKNDAGSSVASGVYFYRIEAAALSGSAGAFSATKKMILMR